MKIDLTEHEGCFAIEMTAENMQEAAALVRFAMNRTDRINSAYTTAQQNGDFSSQLVFAKSRRANSDVPRRK